MNRNAGVAHRNVRRPHRHGARRSAFAAAGLVVATGLWILPVEAASPVEKTPIAPAVTVLTLQPTELLETQLVTGSIVPREEVLVAPQIEGLQIIEILADQGDQVKAGQVLLRLSRDQLNAQMDQMTATLAMSRAQIEQAQSQIVQAQAALEQSAPALKRAEELLKVNAGTQAIVEQRAAEQRTNEARLVNARNGLAVAVADQAAKQAQAKELEVKLARTEIRSSVDGLVSRRTARIGSIASALNEPLFRIIARGEVELEADVPEFNLHRLIVGLKARVVISPELSVDGTIRLVATEVDPLTRLGKVRIALPADPRIRIGSFARGTIEVSRKTAIALPLAALQYDGHDAFAQVVKDGHVVERKVKPGLMTQGLIEISDGLGQGEVVVARAGAFLRDGDAVTSIPVDAKSDGVK